MTTEFHLLSKQDRLERIELGARREREAQSSIPFYAKRAAEAAATGDEMVYWRNCWSGHVNMVAPPRESSIPETET